MLEFDKLQPNQQFKVNGVDEIAVAVAVDSVFCASGEVYCHNMHLTAEYGEILAPGSYEVSADTIEMLRDFEGDPEIRMIELPQAA